MPDQADPRKTFDRIFNALPEETRKLLHAPAYYDPHPKYFNTGECAYCGDPADIVDPIHRQQKRDILVDACTRCVGLLFQNAPEPRRSVSSQTTADQGRGQAAQPIASILGPIQALWSDFLRGLGLFDRRYWLLVHYRKAYSHAKGPKTAPERMGNLRRVDYLRSVLPTSHEYRKAMRKQGRVE